MNKLANFGYDALGAYTIIKLNVKLSDTQAAIIDAYYHNWLKILPNGKLYRIEGVLPHISVSTFKKDLRIAKLQSDIEFLQDELVGLITPVKVPEDWTKADLDNI
jgi:hypothetical protein